MTSQTGTNRHDWRRAVMGGIATGAMAAGLMTGFIAPTAFAQPSEPTTTEVEAPEVGARAPGESCTGDDCSKPVEGETAEAAAPKKMSADEALSIIYNEYAQGDGGGQLSKLIDDAMKLRQQGFRPSKANAAALADALEHRPHQTPLVEALKETLAYQRKMQAQAAMAGEDGSSNPPIVIGPNAGITVPLG